LKWEMPVSSKLLSYLLFYGLVRQICGGFIRH